MTGHDECDEQIAGFEADVASGEAHWHILHFGQPRDDGVTCIVRATAGSSWRLPVIEAAARLAALMIDEVTPEALQIIGCYGRNALGCRVLWQRALDDYADRHHVVAGSAYDFEYPALWVGMGT